MQHVAEYLSNTIKLVELRVSNNSLYFTQHYGMSKTKNKNLMPLKETIVVNYENDTNPVTVSKQQRFLMYQQVVHTVTTVQ